MSNKKGQKRKYKNPIDYKMLYRSVFVTEDETGLKVLNLLSLHYQRDLSHRLRISYSFIGPFTDHQRAFFRYCWVSQTSLAWGDGRPACVVHISAIYTSIYTYHYFSRLKDYLSSAQSACLNIINFHKWSRRDYDFQELPHCSYKQSFGRLEARRQVIYFKVWEIPIAMS